jgi:hypothetical protein
MNYEQAKRIERLSNFVANKKSSQIDFKEHGTRFFAYVQDDGFEVLESRYDVIFDKNEVYIKLVINSDIKEMQVPTIKQTDLFSYLD